MKRRGFMGGVMAAFATTPEKVLKLSGTAEVGIGADVVAYARSLAGKPVSSASQPWWVTERLKLIALKTVRPNWFEAQRRRQAKHVAFLDTDIAALRSVSPAAKIAIMRERQYQRAIDEQLDYLDARAGEEGFKL